VKLDLTIEQINVVLQSLAQGPYAQVEGVIREIRSQVQPQLVPKEAETAGKEKA
jgi:hypothetical protein